MLPVGCSLHYTTHQGGERGHCNGSSTTSPSTLLSPLSSSSTSTSSPLVSSYLHHHRHHHNLLPLALCYNFYPNISIAISDLVSGENNQSSERFLMTIKQLELKYICQQQNIHSKIVKVCRACFQPQNNCKKVNCSDIFLESLLNRFNLCKV